MATRAVAHHPLSIVGLGWGFSAALVVLFVLCLLIAMLFPLPLAHGWVGMFTTAPAQSGQAWIEGIFYSIVVGWLAAFAFGYAYNRCVAR